MTGWAGQKVRLFQKIRPHVPEAELYCYATSRRSMTQGRGIHQARFLHYQPMPRNVQEELMASRAAVEEA